MNIYIYCEGQTEESFVKKVLSPYFVLKGVYLTPIICRTKEGPSGVFKGGITDYNKAVAEIRKICLQHSNEKVTSFMDYYGLKNIPTLSYNGNNKYLLISSLENKLGEDVGCQNFIPYVSLHEFESLLFSDTSQFVYLNNAVVADLNKILSQFNNNPELINSGQETAPSKRIKKLIPYYGKLSDGNIIAQNITLMKMRERCEHFSSWIDKLEKIV